MSSTKPLKSEPQPSSSKPLDRLQSIKRHLSPGSQDPSPFLRNTERPKYIPEKKPFDNERPVKAIIVGAGIAGIATSILLSKKIRNLSYTLYDKNASVGGTWAENIYPGVRCDVPSHAYQLTFEPNPHWTEFYAEGPEIHKYYKSVVEKYDVTSHLKLRHQVVRAVWSQDDSKWHFDVKNLETGEVVQDTADFFISAIGRLNQWAYPNIPGLEDVYEGHLRHTSNWDTKYDYSGKRVAVIGNGASGMQIVPNILPTVAHLEHYIRSKVWISPTFRGGLIVASADNPGGLSYSAAERAEFEADPAKYLAYRKELETNFHGGFLGGILGSKENEATREAWRKTMFDRVGGDPEWLEKLVPDYAPGCKRPTPAPGYLEALLDPKTTFHSSPILRATKTGLVTADGNESQVDAIIAATGHANSFVPRFPIINQNNVNLQEKWSTEGPIGFPETYFGIMAPGFPNYFFVMQANGNGAGGTVPLQCELSATYIAKAIRKIQSQSYSSLTPTEQATDDFNAIVNAYFDDKAAGDNCNSWFKQGKGNTRNLIAWPGTAHHRLAIQRDPRWEDFEYSRRKGAEKNIFEYFGSGWTERERKEEKHEWTNYLHEVGKIDLETLHENWNE